MRIVQVCPYSWSARGGVQTHVRQLSRLLSARGHEVLVLAAGPLRHHDASAGAVADARRENTDRPSIRMVGRSIQIPFNGSLAPVCVDPRCVAVISDALRAFQPEVVHVHEPFVPIVSLSAVWLAPAPVVATFHAYCPPSVDAWLSNVATRSLWPVGRRIAVSLSVSRTAAAYAVSRGGGQMRIVPNGVDVEAFARAHPASPTSGRTLLWVGRLDRRKGFDVAVRAFSTLCERYSDLSLLVVGSGPCRRVVDDVPHQVRRRIVMMGDVDDDRLPSVYAAGDVFIAPAVEGESFGVVLLEAMASGRPIVAAGIEGYRDVVRADIDALVVRPGDAQALSDAIARVLDDRPLARRLALAAQEGVRQFRWAAVTNTIEQTYRELVRTTVVKPGDASWMPREGAARGVARGVAK